MATTLAAALTDGDLIASVAAALSADRDGDFFVQIDTEYLLVERRGMLTNPQVKRAMLGTTAAAHLSGADVLLVIPQVQTAAPADPPVASDGSPLDPPELPALPTAQDLADALVALGLVTQAPTSRFVQHIGDTSTGSAGTTTVLSVSKTVTVGDLIVVGWGCGDGSKGPVSATDNLGNVYSVAEAPDASSRTAVLLSAPITVGGALTTITITHGSTSNGRVAIAAEFSGVGTLATVGGGSFSASTSPQTWDANKTIPASGLAVGFVMENADEAISAGAASGTPSTAVVLEAYHGDNPNYSAALLYALAEGVAVTGFSGTGTTGAPAASAQTAGANFNGI